MQPVTARVTALLMLTLTHAQTFTHTHVRTHARTHTHTYHIELARLVRRQADAVQLHWLFRRLCFRCCLLGRALSTTSRLRIVKLVIIVVVIDIIGLALASFAFRFVVDLVVLTGIIARTTTTRIVIFVVIVTVRWLRIAERVPTLCAHATHVTHAQSQHVPGHMYNELARASVRLTPMHFR
jgi:hypothetical protein